MGCGVSSLALVQSKLDVSPPPKPSSKSQISPVPVNLNQTGIRALRRITGELKTVQLEHPEFTVTPFNLKDSYYDWVVLLPGPVTSAYAGGEFLLDVSFPETYPLEPPKLKFRTPVFHPNISNSGKVCLNILKSGEWSPLLTLATVLLSVQALLCDPNPDDPLNLKAADLLIKDSALFHACASSWTRTYATPGHPKFRSQSAQHQTLPNEEEDAQEFEHLQRDPRSGRLIDEDDLIRRLVSSTRRSTWFC